MILFDASALLPLLTPEERSVAARGIRDANRGEVAVTDYAAGEVASGLSRLVRMKLYPPATMTAAWQSFADWRDNDTVAMKIEPADVRRATEFVLDWSLCLRLPDAIHLAVATRLALPFVTLDKRLMDAGRRLNVEIVTF